MIHEATRLHKKGRRNHVRSSRRVQNFLLPIGVAGATGPAWWTLLRDRTYVFRRVSRHADAAGTLKRAAAWCGSITTSLETGRTTFIFKTWYPFALSRACSNARLVVICSFIIIAEGSNSDLLLVVVCCNLDAFFLDLFVVLSFSAWSWPVAVLFQNRTFFCPFYDASAFLDEIRGRFVGAGRRTLEKEQNDYRNYLVFYDYDY